MILRSDDDIYVVDQRWYGPPGRTLPWAARYAAYGWGFALYVGAMLIERVLLRIGMSAQSVLFTLLGVSLATTYLMRRVDPDRPMLTVLRGYWHELRTPRPKPTDHRGRPTTRRTTFVLVRPARGSLPDELGQRLSQDSFA